MALKPKNRAEWDKWAARVRKGQLASLDRAYEKVGFRRLPEGSKKFRKVKAGKPGKSSAPSPTGPDNVHEFVCPECWGVPDSMRNNGMSLPRHEPFFPGGELIDDEHCKGQGRMSVVVLDPDWKPGTKAEKTATAKKFLDGKVKR